MNNNIATQREFFLLLARIHTKINCGHSSFHPGGEIYSKVDSTQKAFFPMHVKFIKDTLIVAEDFQEIKKGSQILSINGKSIEEIRNDAFQIISSDGYNTTFKHRLLEEEFADKYYLFYGAANKFELEIIPYLSDETQQLSITAFATTDYGDHPGREQEATDFEFLDDETALLTVNTFSTETSRNQKKFFKFLKKSFKEIKKKNTKNLIIDIRENTGGDDGNDMELASYLINKPFKENKFRKLHSTDLPLYPEYLHPMWKEMFGISSKKTDEQIKKKIKSTLNDEFSIGEDGAYYLKDENVIRRDPAKYLFDGNTYILISGKVFSGGSLFSALVRDKSDAVFVGEETGGGYYRHTGSIPLFYTLPNSGMMFSLFIVINEQDVDQQLFPEGSGLKPHFEVYPSIKDFVEDRDAVMEYVKGKIKK